MTDVVLVLNSGSSSVKFALLDPGPGKRVLDGLAERVGTPEAVLRIRRSADDAVTERLTDSSYKAVIARILHYLPEAGHGAAGDGEAGLAGVGHRVVHGGERFTAAWASSACPRTLRPTRGTAARPAVHHPARAGPGDGRADR